MKRTREKICSPVNSDRLSHVQQPTTALCGTDQVSRCRLMSNCELIFCYMSGSKGKTHLGCWLTHRIQQYRRKQRQDWKTKKEKYQKRKQKEQKLKTQGEKNFESNWIFLNGTEHNWFWIYPPEPEHLTSNIHRVCSMWNIVEQFQYFLNFTTHYICCCDQGLYLQFHAQKYLKEKNWQLE